MGLSLDEAEQRLLDAFSPDRPSADETADEDEATPAPTP